MSDLPDRQVLLLVRMGIDSGGRVDPARILKRKLGSAAREAFLSAQDEGWLNGEGWVTDAGREEVAFWLGASSESGTEARKRG